MPEHQPPPTYDPYRLIAEVQTLLRKQGLLANVPPGQSGMALAGAGQLLRSMGITPAMNMADAVDLDRDFTKDP